MAATYRILLLIISVAVICSILILNMQINIQHYIKIHSNLSSTLSKSDDLINIVLPGRQALANGPDYDYYEQNAGSIYDSCPNGKCSNETVKQQLKKVHKRNLRDASGMVDQEHIKSTAITSTKRSKSSKKNKKKSKKSLRNSRKRKKSKKEPIINFDELNLAADEVVNISEDFNLSEDDTLNDDNKWYVWNNLMVEEQKLPFRSSA